MSRLGNWRCINLKREQGQSRGQEANKHRAHSKKAPSRVRVHSIYPGDLFQTQSMIYYWIQTCNCFLGPNSLKCHRLPFQKYFYYPNLFTGRAVLSWQPTNLFFMMLPSNSLAKGGCGKEANNHHANRRTPKWILLSEIFSALLLHGKPIPGITDYKQQQTLYQASCPRLRTLIYWRGCGRGCALNPLLFLTHQIKNKTE